LKTDKKFLISLFKLCLHCKKMVEDLFTIPNPDYLQTVKNDQRVEKLAQLANPVIEKINAIEPPPNQESLFDRLLGRETRIGRWVIKYPKLFGVISIAGVVSLRVLIEYLWNRYRNPSK
jgi:hypothetical protein